MYRVGGASQVSREPDSSQGKDDHNSGHWEDGGLHWGQVQQRHRGSAKPLLDSSVEQTSSL